MRKIILCVTSVLLAACGGGSSSGGGAPLTGPTMHAGEWELIANILINAGGTAETQQHTTSISIDFSGFVSIKETDSDCALTIAVNGDTMTYREDCTINTENGPCILGLRSTATIGSNTISGNFGPESRVCKAVSVSYSGNLVGTKM